MKKRILPNHQGRLEIFELIGQGSSGSVHRAVRSDASNTIFHEVAIKILNSEKLVEEWKAEFESLCRVNSSRCVRVFGYEWIEGRPALILEYIQGVTLDELARNFRLSEGELAYLFVEARQGLVDLSEFNLCHGDMSAKNIMVDLSGQVRLFDYGLGNTRPGRCRFTPKFAAPEILLGHSADLASDLWSLGAIFKYMCRGIAANKFWSSLEKFCRLPKDQRLLWPLPIFCKDRAQKELSWKVRELVERRAQSQSVTQSVLAQSVDNCAQTQRNFWSWRTALSLFALLSTFELGGSGFLIESLGAQDQSSLRFRSNYSIEVRFDQGPAQSIPFDLPSVSPGAHRVRWQGPRGEGERVLTLRPGEHKVLDDRFFSSQAKGAGRELLGCDPSRCGSGAH